MGTGEIAKGGQWANRQKRRPCRRGRGRTVWALLWLVTVGVSGGLAGQAPRPLAIEYRVAFPAPHTHLFEVTMKVGRATGATLDLQLPVWTPGSYLVREYARHVQDFRASDGAGRPLRWEKIDKATWRVATQGSETVEVFYRVYANELATQTSHLDADHAYFNGASLFLYVPGAKSVPHRLKIEAPAGWRVTCPLGLEPDADGYFTAPDYDRLVDAPTMVGTHRLLSFTVGGKLHRVAIMGRFPVPEERFVKDLSKIVEVTSQIFGDLPYEHYTFLILLQPGIGGGTEHLNSNVSMGSPDALATVGGYRQFLGLESHEFFHTWNVKRLRPLALGPFDYQRENYTRSLWVAEGLTSYYDDLILHRAGLLSKGEYLGTLAGALAGHDQQPGRLMQSAESSSFDTWIKQYRPDENSINTAISYYTRGQILGLLFDLEIRARTKGERSLDDVMRRLYQEYGLPRPGFTEAQLKATFEAVAGGDLTTLWKRHVEGAEEIDFGPVLARLGLELTKGWQPGLPATSGVKGDPGTIGLRIRSAGDRAIIANVLAGQPGYEAGLNAGDELVALDGLKLDAGNATRRLNELLAGQTVGLSVFRREALRTFSVTASRKPYDRYLLTDAREASAEAVQLRRGWLRE